MGRRTGRAIILIAVLAAALATGAERPAAAADASRHAWGFDRSDLTPHPGVRFGVLPNGMRYALMRNAVPAGGLSVRLHVAAGATVEEERQQGFMHVIEHMIFEGSKTLPKGALLLMLPQQGLKRFADFNAVTDYDETIYRLDLTKSDRRSRDTALTVMREVGSHLLFDRRNVAGAKAAVLAEISARDQVRDRIIAAQTAFFMPNSAISRASVTGTPASVRRARGEVLQRLYARHYVPRSTTLVLVGDFDPATAEAEVVARFADWQGPAPIPIDRRPTAIAKPRGTEARLFVDLSAPTGIVIAAAEPLGTPDAAARRDAVYLEHLGAEMLGRRLARAAAQANAPFAEASAAIYDHFATARIARIDLAAGDRDWRRALQAGAAELARALENGFSQAELDTQLAVSRRALLASATARTSAQLADGLVDAVGRKIVFTAPSDPSATQAYLARIRLAEVNAAFRAAWSSPARLIFVSHNERIPDAQAAITAAWTQGLRKNVGQPLLP